MTAGSPRLPPWSSERRSTTWNPPLARSPLWHATQERSSKGWMSRVNSTGGAVLSGALVATKGAVAADLATARVVAGTCVGSSDVASAITAQLVPAAEIH